MNAASRKRDRNETSDDDPPNAGLVAVSMEAVLSSNFEELARRFPDFGVVWKRNSKLQTPEVRMALARTLLQAHWSVSLSHVPDQYLCPPIPNRYYYVRWMLDTVLPMTSSSDYFDCSTRHLPPSSSVPTTSAALDIGTGAFCIYPLLVAANYPSIQRIFATDVDATTLECAHQHVALNTNLQSRIQLLLVPPTQRQMKESCDDRMDDEEEDCNSKGPLRISLEQIRSVCQDQMQLQFAMTNPPFYDVGEVPASQANMTQNEGHYPGGETAFGMDMILDGLSLYLSANSTPSSSNTMSPPVWTSTMCGKKSSWIILRNTVTQLLGPAHVCASEFGPGSLTRWFLAWTFTSHPHARSPMARHDMYEFQVSNATTSEVVDRFRAYCSTFPWGALSCNALDVTGNTLLIAEASPPALGPWKGDDSLPESIRSILSGQASLRNLFLPHEGHFCIQVKLVNYQEGVQVGGVSFIHSENGRKTVDKIRGQLEGEICRTNRRWRRKLKAPA